MKFLCRNCKAKYQIADEKVAGRTLRMTCQQCGEPIVVRGPARQATHATGGRPLAPMPMAAAAPALSGADLSRLSPSRESAAIHEEWHVAINDTPVGPLRRDEVARKIAQGAVDRESLAWREGMDDWLAIKHIAELASLFQAPTGAHQAPPHVQRKAQATGAARAIPTATMRGDNAPIGGRQMVASVPAEYAQPDSDPPAEVAIATVSPITAPVLTATVPLSVPAPAPAPAPVAAAAAAPAPVAPISPTGEAAGRPPWAQMFALVSGGAFILALGVLLGVRVLSPSTPATSDETEVAAAPPRKPAQPPPPPAAEAKAEPEQAEPENGNMIELDPTAIDGNANVHKSSGSASAPASNGASNQAKPAPDKKGALTADQRAMLERMGGRIDQGGPSGLRAPTETAHASGAQGQGALTAEQLSSVVMNGRKHLQRCYETALRGANSTDTVRLDVDITVSPSGNVTSARTAGKGLPGMDDCIVRTVKMWRFPMSGEVTSTRFPVVFQPGA